MSEDRCAGSNVWTLAVPPGDVELLGLVANLAYVDPPWVKGYSLVYPCEDCTAETMGTIFHAQPWADREDIERALFEVAA